MTSPYLTIKEAAALLHLQSLVSVHRRLSKFGWRYRRDGRRVLILREDVERHLGPIQTRQRSAVRNPFIQTEAVE